MTAAQKAESEQEDQPGEGSLSEISSFRGEGQHCESERVNHTAASGSAGTTGNRNL